MSRHRPHGMRRFATAQPAAWLCGLVLGLIPLAGGCGGSTGVEAAAGTVEVVLTGQTDLNRWSGVRMTLVGPRDSITLDIGGFTVDETFGDLRARPLLLGDRGPLLVKLTLLDAQDTVADGSVSFDLTGPSRWFLFGSLTNSNPTFECVGCQTRSIPLSPAFQQSEKEAVWLVLEPRPLPNTF